jgi:hypothetical protein
VFVIDDEKCVRFILDESFDTDTDGLGWIPVEGASAFMACDRCDALPCRSLARIVHEADASSSKIGSTDGPLGNVKSGPFRSPIIGARPRYFPRC